MINQSSRGIEIHNATTVTNLLVEDSEFIDSISGTNVGLRVASTGHIDGVVITDTVFDGNALGFYVANDGGSSTAKDILITGSTFKNIANTAIFLEEAQDTTIEYNQFTGNRRDIMIFKWYQASVAVKNVVIRDNTMTGTTNAVFAIFNAHHISGQTEFEDGISFVFNTADTNDASAVFAGAHSNFQNADPSDGGVGWDTVTVSCNSFLGITSAGNGVRFFDPDGVDHDTLGGASIDVTNNWWGTTKQAVVKSLMQLGSITKFSPKLKSEPTESCDVPLND